MFLPASIQAAFMWSKKYSDNHNQPLRDVLGPFLVYIQVLASIQELRKLNWAKSGWEDIITNKCLCSRPQPIVMVKPCIFLVKCRPEIALSSSTWYLPISSWQRFTPWAWSPTSKSSQHPGHNWNRSKTKQPCKITPKCLHVVPRIQNLACNCPLPPSALHHPLLALTYLFQHHHEGAGLPGRPLFSYLQRTLRLSQGLPG